MNYYCRYCNNSKLAVIYDKVAGSNIDRQFQIVNCSNCHLTMSFPYLTRAETAAYYDQQVLAFNGEGGDELISDYLSSKSRYWKNLGYEKRLRELLRYIPAEGSILDVGCGAGIFLDLCKATGMKVAGIELSEWGNKTASRRLGIKTYKNSIDKIQTSLKQRFNAITMYDVLEHVDNPGRDLKAAYRLLKPGGVLIINLPNFDSLVARLSGPHWNKLIPPNHTYYFNRDTLKKLVQQAGFKVEGLTTNSGDSREIAWHWILGGWWSLSKRSKRVKKVFNNRAKPWKSDKSPLALLFRATLKAPPILAWAASISKPLANAAQKGEGLHLVALKPK